jgi:hypothetical protein
MRTVSFLYPSFAYAHLAGDTDTRIPGARIMIAKRSPFKKGEIDYVKLMENPSFEGKKIGIYPLSPEDLASE